MGTGLREKVIQNMTEATKTAAELKAERAELNKAIRAAERAEKKAAEKALLDAKHTLGVWLADGLGATTLDEVEALRGGVDLNRIRERLASPVATESDDQEATSSDDPAADSSTSPEVDEGHGEAGISTSATYSYGQ